MRSVTRTACAAILAIAPVSAALADEVASFYKGGAINLYVGFAPGGGADLWGRFIARHLGAHVPGNPSVVVRNMPGAGGFTVVGHVFNNAPKDGTAIVMPSTSAISAPKMGLPNVRWDSFQFTWLGNLTRDVSGCVTFARSGVKSITDATHREIVFGADGVDDPASHHPRMLANLLGFNNRVIAGYKGTGPALVAVERGEIDARCSVWASLAITSMKDDIASGKIVPIVQMSARAHPIFGDAPLAVDLARNEEERQIMSFLLGPLEISRPLAAPPGVPQARIDALRKAVWDAANSDALRAEAEKLNLVIDPMTGEQTEAALRAALNVSEDLIARARTAIRME